MKGPFGDISEFWEKSLIVPKKIEKRDHLVSSCFVGYLKKIGGPFALSSLWSDLALVVLVVSVVRKVDQSG